jgi:type IV pilus assembly protein PilQ
MQLKKGHLLILILNVIILLSTNSFAQDRFSIIESQLKELSKKTPGLLENVEISVTNASLPEFLKTIATTHNLNLNVDVGIDAKVSNSFSNVSVIDVLIFVCRNYSLDVNYTGTIISFSKYSAPVKEDAPKPVVQKVIKVSYDTKNDLLNMDIKDDTLYAVAKEISKATGKNLVVSPELNSKLVSAYVQNLSFAKGILNLAYGNDLKITLNDDGIFLIEKKDKEVNTQVAGNRPKTGKSEKKSSTVDGLTFQLNEDSTITVKAENVAIEEILDHSFTKLNYNYFLFSEIKGSSNMNVANVSFDDFLKLLFNATDFTYKKVENIYLLGDRTIEGLRQTKLFQLRYRTAEKLVDVIPAELKKNVDVKAFPELNSIILSGSQPKIEEMELFLMEIDKVVPVVLIEVLIVDIQNTRTVSTGIEAGLGNNPSTTSGKIFPSIDLSLNSSSINNLITGINGWGVVNLGKVTPNFYLNIKALEQQGYLKLRSTPKLATLNGHEAKLSIGRTEYYLESSTTIVGSVTTGTQTAVSYKPISADLAITINPMVSGDEQITLNIGVKQSNFTTRISPTAPPGTITRDFQSLVRVKNEEMVILGGLEENTSSDVGSGVPLLSRIPILKWFFSSRTKAKNKNKLTIFIKPTVVY